MVAVKAVLEKLDEAPEKLRQFYVEEDGKFFLNLEGLEDLPAVAPLQNACKRLEQQNRAARKQIKALKERLAKWEEFERLRAKIKQYETGDK